ncbi:arabinose-proton symporter [Bacteroidia bacterium]|nr:arabinose-proton symporter [Bacteroidia bacterium]
MEYQVKQKSKSYVWMLAFGAAMGGFLFGYDLSLISGAISFLQDHFHLTEFQKGWMISSAMLGAAAGPFLGLWVADKWGRKQGLLFSALLLMISAIGCAMADTVTWFVIWRILGGLGIGLSSVISPVYIAEIAPTRMRGILATTNQLAIVIGILISILVDYGLSFGGHWRWMFGSVGIPVAAFFVFLAIIPNSPRWLMIRGRNQEAEKIIRSIETPQVADREVQAIKADLGKKETGSFRELFAPGLKTALFVGIMVMIYNQIVGTTILHMYAPTIMYKLGLGDISESILSAAYIDTWMLVCTIAAFWVIARLGRRQVLFLGFSLIMAGHLLMAASIQWGMAPIWALVALCVSIGAHSLTLGPIPWSICTEIFPNRVRAKAMSITMIGFYGFNWAGNTFFPQISAYFTRTSGNDIPLYLILVAICISGLIFTKTSVPETKNISLEEIGDYWKGMAEKRASERSK